MDLHTMAQKYLDLGIFQQIKLVDVIYTQHLLGYQDIHGCTLKASVINCNLLDRLSSLSVQCTPCVWSKTFWILSDNGVAVPMV